MARDDIDDDVVLCVMVLMTLADGRVAEPEVTRTRWIYGKVAERPVSEEEIRGVIARVRADGLDIDGYLESIRGEIGREGRRKLLASAYAIATADGRVLDQEDALMLRIAKVLEITPSEYRACLGQMKVARALEEEE